MNLTPEEVKYLQALAKTREGWRWCEGAEWSNPVFQSLRGREMVKYLKPSNRFRAVKITDEGRNALRQR